MVRHRLFCLALIVLSGCGPDYRWTKPGVAADVVAADRERCSREAAAEASRRFGGRLELLHIEQATANTRPVGSAEISPALRARLEEDRLRRVQDSFRTQTFRDCMEKEGYVLTPP